MNVVIVYESMFGNTRSIAERIARGIEHRRATPPHRISVTCVADVTAADVAEADLLVVGAPTHAHSLPRPESRAQAADWSADPERHLELEEHALDRGVREWLDGLPPADTLCAAFDTRADIPKPLSGAASHRITRRLARTGRRSVLAPESFRVTIGSHPEDEELDRAVVWGKSLALATEILVRDRTSTGAP
ncbi:hypothetical protein ELQ92_13160 [Labedella populi]|uniref:Flavodoxin-like domain-containing protein n=1 Tax=Labedella populi TaxID=2498850 RepID=A0A3S3ZNG5_9MICO|nr:flavodoxin domain-containing protein [Labedella populi]RWZ59211.1 hypothetical protein ELQ92_13160 [Labedella populi]